MKQIPKKFINPKLPAATASSLSSSQTRLRTLPSPQGQLGQDSGKLKLPGSAALRRSNNKAGNLSCLSGMVVTQRKSPSSSKKSSSPKKKGSSPGMGPSNKYLVGAMNATKGQALHTRKTSKQSYRGEPSGQAHQVNASLQQQIGAPEGRGDLTLQDRLNQIILNHQSLRSDLSQEVERTSIFGGDQTLRQTWEPTPILEVLREQRPPDDFSDVRGDSTTVLESQRATRKMRASQSQKSNLKLNSTQQAYFQPSNFKVGKSTIVAGTRETGGSSLPQMGVLRLKSQSALRSGRSHNNIRVEDKMNNLNSRSISNKMNKQHVALLSESSARQQEIRQTPTLASDAILRGIHSNGRQFTQPEQTNIRAIQGFPHQASLSGQMQENRRQLDADPSLLGQFLQTQSANRKFRKVNHLNKSMQEQSSRVLMLKKNQLATTSRFRQISQHSQSRGDSVIASARAMGTEAHESRVTKGVAPEQSLMAPSRVDYSQEGGDPMASIGGLSREETHQIQGHSISSIDLDKHYPKSAQRPGGVMNPKHDAAPRFKTSQKTSALLNKLAHPGHHGTRATDSVSSSGRQAINFFEPGADSVSKQVNYYEQRFVQGVRNFIEGRSAISAATTSFETFFNLKKDICAQSNLPELFNNLQISGFDGRKQPLLHFVVSNCVSSTFIDKILIPCLQAGFNPNIQNRSQHTALSLAFTETVSARIGELCCRITSCLVDAGANPSLKVEGSSALHSAASRVRHPSSCCCLNILARAVKETNQIDILDEEGRSPLHVAILNRKPTFVQSLLEGGANPQLREEASQLRPLHLVCSIGCKLILNTLILALFESSQRFQLNEKTLKQDDPLDLLIDFNNSSSSADDYSGRLREVLQCIRLLVGFGHPLKERHLDRFLSHSELEQRVHPSNLNDVCNLIDETKSFIISKLEEKHSKSPAKKLNQSLGFGGFIENTFDGRADTSMVSEEPEMPQVSKSKIKDSEFSCDIKSLTQYSARSKDTLGQIGLSFVPTPPAGCEKQIVLQKNQINFEQQPDQLAVKKDPTQTPPILKAMDPIGDGARLDRLLRDIKVGALPSARKEEKLTEQYTSRQLDDQRQEMLNMMGGGESELGEGSSRKLVQPFDPEAELDKIKASAGSKFLDFEYMSKQGIRFDQKSSDKLNFDLIFNQKGERVLAVQNLTSDDEMIFINLSKLVDKPSEAPMKKTTEAASLLEASEPEIREIQRKNNVNLEYEKLELLKDFPLRIEETELQRGRVIGQGAHACVYAGDYFGSSVAIKEYEGSNMKSAMAFVSELKAYSSGHGHRLMSHPGIVQVVGAFSDGPKNYLVTELSEVGSIQNLLWPPSGEGLSLDLKLKACMQVASALDFLHRQEKLIHRDVKAENILVFARGPSSIQVKLCDFGVSCRSLEDERDVSMGTIPWMAPEWLSSKKFSEKSDSYSFGIFLYEVFCLPLQSQVPTAPYAELEPVQIMFQVSNDDLRPEIADGSRQQCPTGVINLIEKCWERDPAQRPSSLYCLDKLSEIYKELKQTS